MCLISSGVRIDGSELDSDLSSPAYADTDFSRVASFSSLTGIRKAKAGVRTVPTRTALRVNIEASLATVDIDDTVCCSPKQRCSGSFRSVGRATFVSIINLPTSAHVKPRSRPSLPGQPASLGEHAPARTIGACGRCKLRINSRFQCLKTVPRQSRPYSGPARRPTWRSSILFKGTISPGRTSSSNRSPKGTRPV